MPLTLFSFLFGTGWAYLTPLSLGMGNGKRELAVTEGGHTWDLQWVKWAIFLKRIVSALHGYSQCLRAHTQYIEGIARGTFKPQSSTSRVDTSDKRLECVIIDSLPHSWPQATIFARPRMVNLMHWDFVS